MAQEASVIKLVNEIFMEAINERASDIHVEPYENELSIRYRIDGVLHEASVPPQISRFQAAIISRIKILSSLNIAEKRLPQDGRIKFQVGGAADRRPRQRDPHAVRRRHRHAHPGQGRACCSRCRSWGWPRTRSECFQELINRPHGIILVTGPTGSGKTTTLYAALQAIVSPEIKVLTVEDPVEYHLDGVNQIQVAAEDRHDLRPRAAARSCATTRTW